MRLLLVDDSASQRLLVGAMLRGSGYEVVEAENGDAALAILRAERIPLVISDWMMPGLDGPALCRAIRALDDGLYRYVLLLTARHAKADVSVGLRAGADEFLSKPVDPGELRARLLVGRRLIETQAALVRRQEEIAGAYRRQNRLLRRIEADLAAAARLQREFLPPDFAEIAGCRIAARCEFASHVGGDHIGYFRAGNGKIGAFSIDVAGHGVAASMVAIRLATHFAGRDLDAGVAFEPGVRDRLRPPESVIADLNHRFQCGDGHDTYFTIAYAAIDVGSGTVALCQAGHPPAAVLAPDGSVSFVEGGSPPVGMLPDADFTTRRFRLGAGERLVLYSDGLTEASTRQGSMLGEDGFAGLLSAEAHTPTERLVDAVLDGFDAATGGRKPADDLSLLVIEMPEPAGRRSRARRRRGAPMEPVALLRA